MILRRKLEYAILLNFVIRILDIAAVVIGGWIGFILRFDAYVMPQNYKIVLLIQAILALLIFPSFKIYGNFRGHNLWWELTRIIKAWSISFLCLLGIAFLTKTGALFSREWAIYWFPITLFLMQLSHLLSKRVLFHCRKCRLDIKDIIIIGVNDLGRQVARIINGDTWANYRLIRFFDESPEITQIDGIAVENLDDLPQFKKRCNVDEIWIALPSSEKEKLNKVMKSLQHSTKDIRLVPDLMFGNNLASQPISQILGIPVIDLSVSPMTGMNRIVKFLEDKILAALILLLVSPLMLFIAVGVKLSSPGPIIFKQQRHGWDGRIIKVYKFRSMKMHAEHTGKVTQASRGDPRITPFGAFLRKNNLDELPQFFNVLQGRMSIVGPRPHAVEHNHYYRDEVENYMRRHKVKPGITGWAQINGWRGETDTLEKMQKRIEYDLYYIDHWSLSFDIKIIILTILRNFFDENAY